MSEQSAPPLSASNAKLVELYRRNYRKHPDYTTSTVNFTAQPEFNTYTGLKVDKSETLIYLGPTLFENFFKHLSKYQRKLDTFARVIYDEHQRGVTERLFADFDKETTLKTEIINVIRSSPEFASSSSSSSKTPRRQLLLNYKTELQKILSLPFNYKGAPSHINLKDPWNPIHVTLSFPLFCRVINTQVHSDGNVDTMVLKKHNRHDGTYKQKYIQHMQSAAESHHEFLLAVVSAFGTDPRIYPSSVLTMMETRNMLNVKVPHKTVSSANPPLSSVVTNGAKKVQEPTGTSKADSQVTHSRPVPSRSPSAHSSSSTSSVAVAPKAQTVPIPTRKEPQTISLDEFKNSVKKCWTLFHGDKNPTSIPSSWYENFSSRFPEPNNRNGILSNCVKVLIWDLELNEWEPGAYRITRLEDVFSKEVKAIKQNLQALSKLPSVTPTAATGLEIVMKNNASLLQQALVHPLKQENANGFGAKECYSIPHPAEWSPSCSLLPFQAFQAHIYWLTKTETKFGGGGQLENLDVEIMKLRYVEFASLLFRQNPRQLVLSIFAAFGPDVLMYPVRVLQILKKQELLRPGTTLHDLIGNLETQDLYDMIFDEGVPIPNELQVQPEQIPSPTPSPIPAQWVIPMSGDVKSARNDAFPPQKVKVNEHFTRTAVISSTTNLPPKPQKVQPNEHSATTVVPCPSASTFLPPKPLLQPHIPLLQPPKPLLQPPKPLLQPPIPLLQPPKPLLQPPVQKASTKANDPKTISLEEFFLTARSYWNMFYGEMTTKPMPTDWHGFFKSQFPHVNNKNGILDNCIQVLFKDKEKIGKGFVFKIHRLIDYFPAEFKDIEKNLHDSIPKYPAVVFTARTGFESFMLNNKSVLQQALIEPLKLEKMPPTATAINQQKTKRVPPPTDWCPSFSVLPFHGFQAHIHWYLGQKGNVGLKDMDIEIFKLRYVEYLSIRMKKIPQLLVGIMTAYGPNALQYPVRVLQILNEAELLRPETKLYSAIGRTKISKTLYTDIFANGSHQSTSIELNSQPVKCSSLTSTPSSSSSSLRSLPAKEIRQEVVERVRDATSEVKRSDSVPSQVPNPQVTAACRSTETEADMLTISSEEFFQCVGMCWNRFYGEGGKKPIPQHWYSRYKSQFPEPNNKNGILGSCVENLLRNDNRIQMGDSYKICLLHDLVPDGSILRMIEMDLAEAVPKHNPSIVISPTNGYDFLMWNNMSSLQAALVAPVQLQSTNSRTPTKKSVSDVSDFHPTDWCPSRSVFPFPAFEAHVYWHCRQNRHMGNPRGLPVGVLKLRFVEYLSQFMYNTNQFLLAVFTAYGHNVMQYPVRVLQILKQRRLLRQGTKLFDVIDGETTPKLYSPIFGNSESTQIPNGIISPPPPPNVPVQKKSLSSEPLPTPLTGEGDAKQRSLSTPSFDDWRAECEKALEELGQNGSIRYKIPDAYYQELFKSYLLITENQIDRNTFRLFILGVWTGSRLADFQLDPPPPPPLSTKQSEPPVPVPGSSLPLSTVSNSESEVGERGVVACLHTTDGKLTLDEGGVRILKGLGITPLDSVESIHNTFVSVKKFELEALEKIVDEFPGEQIKDFVKELSIRICWVSEDEDLKISAMLIGGLISKKLISKAYTINCIRNGVVKNLPEILVKVLHVTSRVASFLSHLFSMEEDFCWFLTMTDELRRGFLPVWVDLSKKTVDTLRRRSSNTAVMEIFARTPGADEFLQAI